MRSKRNFLTITIVIAAVFFASLEMTVLITALPSLGKTFPSEVVWLPWLTTISLLAAGVTLPLAGKLADAWGPKKPFLLGVALFTGGSLLSSLVGVWLPDHLILLVLFRVLQGVGGGVFAPVGLKITSILYQGQKRTAIVGVAGAITPLAALLGPIVGGTLVDHFPWQSIFLINVPVGLIIGLSAILLMEDTPSRVKTSIDLRGALLLSVATLSLMLGFTWGREYGIGSGRVIGGIFLAFLLVVFLYWLEKRHPAPMIDLDLIRERWMASILALSFFHGLTMYSTLYFLSLYAQNHPAIRASGSIAGMMLSPAALGQVIVAPLVGVSASKIGYRSLVILGIAIMALSHLVLAAEPTSIVFLAGLLILSRIGGSASSVPMAAAGLEARQAQAGIISGLRQLSNVLGGAIGPVLLSVLLRSTGEGTQAGFGHVFLVMTILLVATIPLARLIPIKEIDTSAVIQTRT